MADEPVINNTDTGGGADPVNPPAPQVVDRLTPEMEQELAYYRNLDQQLQSKRGVIDQLLGDEDAYGVAEAALKARESYRAAQDDRPKWAKELADDLKAVKTKTEQDKTDSEIIGARAYVEALAQTYPQLREGNWKAVNELEREAEGLGIKSPRDKVRYIESVVKRTSTPTQRREEPPESLRADAGNPGIPGRREAKPKNPQDIRQILIDRAKAANG